ncbi:MAG: nitroreductase [Burkholderiales bacterium]|nr:nitroreductase [Burkholderiales bacterium]
MHDQAIVDRAITSRRSVRGFLPTPIPRATIEDILTVASRAPSGTNIQPWKVHVLTGEARARFCAAVVAAHDEDYARSKRGEPPQNTVEYGYYPDEWFEPYLGRRRKIGWDLYGLLGIGKKDYDRMHAQHRRNFTFFDAPVGLIFTIDRRMRQGSWLDYGMFLENIMIAARGRGLDTCPQQAFAHFHGLIGRHLGLPDSDMVVCGMALGHEDRDEPANRLVTERAPLADFVTFVED